MPKDLTVAQLERMLHRKRARLDNLLQRRARLQKQLARLEIAIASIGGVVQEGRKSRRTRKRPKNNKTLFEAVSEVLSHHKKGITLKELAARILEGGYKTGSTNFENTVYQIIYNNRDKVMHDARTKSYRLR